MSDIQSVYAKRASKYDDAVKKLFKRWFINDDKYRRKVVKKLNLKKSDAVLEIGCGTGLNFQYLQRAVGENGMVVALDLTLAMLKKAKERVKMNRWKNVYLIQGNAALLPLNRSFNAALSTYAMSLVSPYEKAVYEATSILKQGGKIAILDFQPFQGLFKVFNLILAVEVKPYVNNVTKYMMRNSRRCVEAMKRTLRHVELEQHYFGMIYIASGMKEQRETINSFSLEFNEKGQDRQET